MADQAIPLILGVDGGATKTIALLGDARTGAILGQGRSRGSNFHAHDPEVALRELAAAIDHAFTDAGIPRQTVIAACLGVAGVSRPADEQMVKNWVRDHGIADRVLIANDGWLVISAGTPDGVGVGLICGTGSIAVGRAADGSVARAGGWGYLIGDEGSGYDVALLALRAVSHAADGRGPATALLPALLAHWQLYEPADLITHLYGVPDPRTQLAGVGALVVAVADGGDPVACDIIERAAHELTSMVGAVAQRVALPAPIPVAVAGSMIVQSEILQHAVQRAAAARGFPITLQVVVDPTIGALRIAQRLAQGDTTLASEW